MKIYIRNVCENKMGTDDGGKMEMNMQQCSIKRTGVSKE